MIELPGIANEYAQYIFVCISIEIIYSHINLFMYKYYAYSWACKLSAPNGENRVNPRIISLWQLSDNDFLLCVVMFQNEYNCAFEQFPIIF